MSTRDIGEMPAALPKDVVDQIFSELAQSGISDKRLAKLRSGDLRYDATELLAFVQAAMEYPHFANGVEISNAIGAKRESVQRAIWFVKINARTHRRVA